MSGDDSHGCGDIRAAMVAHAHYLRRQCTYVGQCSLVLFCISRGVRLHLWEGGTRTDLVSLYAPWAAEHCPEEKTLWADVIAVHLSHGELHYICDTVPLGRVNHFVVGEPLVPVSGDASGSHGSGEAASWCDAFYQRLGLRVRETIADGDCALDALCIVSVADRTLASRNAIRAELSNLLLNSLGNSLMENTFAMCQEHAVESPGAHAPAVVGSHLAGAADGTVARSDETSEALAWACGIKNASSAMVGRVRSALPEWCLAGVVQRYMARPSAAGADGAIVSTVVEVGRGKPGRVRRQYNGSRVKTRNTDAASFVEFSRAAGVNPSKAWPYGHVQRFLADTPGVKPMTLERMMALRRYYRRAVNAYLAHASADSAMVYPARQQAAHVGGER